MNENLKRVNEKIYNNFIEKLDIIITKIINEYVITNIECSFDDTLLDNEFVSKFGGLQIEPDTSTVSLKVNGIRRDLV
jgi:hypothetical protein